MVSLTLLSTVLMGLLVVAALVAIERIGTKREPPRTAEGDLYDRLAATFSDVVSNPAVWALTFVAFAVGVGGLAVLAIGDFGLSEGAASVLLGAVYGLVGVLIAGFVFLGAYGATRERGLGNAHGIAAGTLALGLLFLLLVSVQLTVGVIG